MEEYIRSVCFSLIAISLYKSVIPDRGYKKTISLVVGLMLLTIIFEPLEKMIGIKPQLNNIISDMERKIDSSRFEGDIDKFILKIDNPKTIIIPMLNIVMINANI